MFPGALITLRVFETRYREMLDDCLNRRIGFGVVLIERGSEVGGGDVRFEVGVAVSIERVYSVGEGHLLVTVRGGDRIGVEEWLEDDPYPQARVRRLPEVSAPVVPPGVRDALGRAFTRGLAMLSEMGMATGGIEPLPRDPLAAAYRALDIFPVPDLDRQRILETGDPVDRIRRATAALDSVNELVEARLGEGRGPGGSWF